MGLVWFGVGLVVGTFAGVLLTCMCVVSRDPAPSLRVTLFREEVPSADYPL